MKIKELIIDNHSREFLGKTRDVKLPRPVSILVQLIVFTMIWVLYRCAAYLHSLMVHVLTQWW